MTKRDPILSDLNEQQREAVTAPDEPILIVAGAGTGKTRVITRRIAFLIRDRNFAPWQIFAATFTNKAAEEMKRRVVDLLPAIPESDLNIATFHSLCARILRREITRLGYSPSFLIADEGDQLSAIRHVMRQLGITNKELKPNLVQEVINQCKMRMLEPSDVGQVTHSRFESEIAEIYAAYSTYMQQSGALDFEDLILCTVRLFTEYPDVLASYQQRYQHIMVDEFQDINDSQYALIRLLAGNHRRITVVGDEDQTIYSWRGANIRHILEFDHFFPGSHVIRLEQNYRSTATILAAASSVISHNKDRFQKTLFTTGGKGRPILVIDAENERDEANAVAELIGEFKRRLRIRFSDIAVFYRTAALSRTYEEKLRQLNIPYKVVGGVRFYDRAEVKDMLGYLQLAANPHSNIAFLRVINTPRRGIGDKTLALLQRISHEKKVSLFSASEYAIEASSLPRGASSSLQQFLEQVKKWNELSTTVLPSQLFEQIRTDVDYDKSLGDPELLEVRSRIEHIEELHNSIAIFETENPSATLQDFLEYISLQSSHDEVDSSEDFVLLMTLHTAKGLEFRCVFIVGCNEGILPHARSVDEGNLEEERRLFYVGMTRAREFLVLSHCAHRVYYGEPRYHSESPFLEEIPSEHKYTIRPEETDFARLVLELIHEGNLRHEEKDVVPPRQKQETEPTRRSHGSSSLVGKRVKHPFLGEGVVERVEGWGRDSYLIIKTAEGDKIKLRAKFADLEICG